MNGVLELSTNKTFQGGGGRRKTFKKIFSIYGYIGFICTWRLKQNPNLLLLRHQMQSITNMCCVSKALPPSIVEVKIIIHVLITIQLHMQIIMLFNILVPRRISFKWRVNNYCFSNETYYKNVNTE